MRWRRPRGFAAPALFLYGGHDELVPAGANAATWRALPRSAGGGPVLAFYPNGYHLLLRDQDRALPIGDILAWIDDPRCTTAVGCGQGSAGMAGAAEGFGALRAVRWPDLSHMKRMSAAVASNSDTSLDPFHDCDRPTPFSPPDHILRHSRSRASLRRSGRGQASRSDRHRRLGLDAGRADASTIRSR